MIIAVSASITISREKKHQHIERMPRVMSERRGIPPRVSSRTANPERSVAVRQMLKEEVRAEKERKCRLR
jgi:hypothetical protein